jgi:hypothetical protein
MELIFDILAVLGGTGVIIIGLSKFIGDILRDRIKERERRRTEQELEYRKQRFGLRRVQAAKFAESQFDVYIELWQSLQGLRLTVDALWHRATKQNIATLARELAETKEKVQKWSIFFEEQHLCNLMRLFETLAHFKTGKIPLVEIRSKEDMEFVYPEEIRYQIEQNQRYKEEFESLLEDMRKSFRNRLSEIE